MYLSKLFISLGYCTEFNVGGGVIQRHLTAKCNNVFPKCDKLYNSMDAYKCMFKKKCSHILHYNILFTSSKFCCVYIRFTEHKITNIFLFKDDFHNGLIMYI